MKKKNWITLAISLLLVAVTVFVVSRQSKTFTAEGFLDYVHSVKPWGMVAAVGCMVGFILFEGLALLVICRAMGYPRSLYSGVLYSAADIYFSAITPSATGGQPASAVLMTRDGIPVGTTTVALLINLIFYTPAIFVVAVIGLILYPAAFSQFGVLSHMLIVIGTLLQLGVLAVFLLVVFREKVFLRIVDFILMLGQKLHLVKNAESRRSKLLEIEGDYRASAGTIRTHWPAMAVAFLLNLLQRFCSVMVPVVLFIASGGQRSEAGRVFSIQACVVLGSNSLPMPGGVGVADYLFLDGYGKLLGDPVNLELLSRTISFYSCVLLCAGLLLISLATRKLSSRK